MTGSKTEIRIHLTEVELADFLTDSLSPEERRRREEHLGICDECLVRMVSAYESVAAFRKDKTFKRKGNFMKKINFYLVLATLTFTLSFMAPGYFLQLLTATLLLGAKWIVDSKSTKMLVMIYEAWKKGDERETSRIIESLDPQHKSRF